MTGAPEVQTTEFDPYFEFYGTGGSKEVEKLNDVVCRQALATSRIEDAEWKASLAGICMSGPVALDWWDGLDTDVKRDWEKLRIALHERFHDPRDLR